MSILTGNRHAQALPVPLGPVHLNSSASVDPRRNSLCIYLEFSINWPVFILFIALFFKTDTRHLVCRPTHLPVAMAHSGALPPAPSSLRARLFPFSSLGRLRVGAPGGKLPWTDVSVKDYANLWRTSIDYFPIPHNTLCLPPKFYITYCLKMLLGKCNTPRSI